MEQMRSFAGVGSRDTPPEIIEQMEIIAELCCKLGYVLHSGGADGADSAFERVYDRLNGPMNIFLPWPGFNSKTSRYARPKPDAFAKASTIHPVWEFLKKDSIRSLIARNMHQVLGWSLADPVDFVVCWTLDGAESDKTYSIRTGGTGAAICLASRYGVPVFNLCNNNRFNDVVDLLEENR